MIPQICTQLTSEEVIKIPEVQRIIYSCEIGITVITIVSVFVLIGFLCSDIRARKYKKFLTKLKKMQEFEEWDIERKLPE